MCLGSPLHPGEYDAGVGELDHGQAGLRSFTLLGQLELPPIAVGVVTDRGACLGERRPGASPTTDFRILAAFAEATELVDREIAIVGKRAGTLPDLLEGRRSCPSALMKTPSGTIA